MLVHLVGSRAEMTQHFLYLRRITSVTKDEGHELVDDWVDQTYRDEVKGNVRVQDIAWKQMYRESVEAINKADVIIAETTVPSFSTGYLVALAAKMKKPTLVLNREGVERSFFASGIDTGIEYHEYTKENLTKIVRKFLRENDIGVKDMRFNFFIDRQIYNYLRYTSLRTGKTKAEILRGLVEKEIEQQHH